VILRQFPSTSPLIAMPLGIRPTNDLAFKKTFGSEDNREPLIGLLNAVLKPKRPIADVAIKNPFKVQDFQDDKLSVLDVKAADDAGAMYDIEMQLEVSASLVQRTVFYGCDLYADQLRKGGDYEDLRPVFSIWLIDGVLWSGAAQVHHAFRLTDAASGRVLDNTLAIHTLELGKYNTREADLAADDVLGCWLYWLRHAHKYETARLYELFPQLAIRQATETLVSIAEISEDKIMYDARERAIRDRKWELDSAKREGKVEGKVEGEIKSIRMLQGLLYMPLSDEQELMAMGLEQLESLTSGLQEKLRGRTPL
jgi:predicted transposase/invertase (TIGR01784 family)